MAKLRSYKPSDLNRIREIHQQYHEKGFEFPDIERAITKAVVTNRDEEVIAFGVARTIAESIMILDPSQSLREKTKALEMLIRHGIFGCELAGYDQLHAFVQDEHFKQVLEKHFAFRECVGKALVLDI